MFCILNWYYPGTLFAVWLQLVVWQSHPAPCLWSSTDPRYRQSGVHKRPTSLGRLHISQSLSLISVLSCITLHVTFVIHFCLYLLFMVKISAFGQDPLINMFSLSCGHFVNMLVILSDNILLPFVNGTDLFDANFI